MKIENCKLKIPSRAFSLVETTAFLVVLMVGFMVFFRLVNSYVFTLKTAKERVIANFLAQEGLELVTAKRNQNFRDLNCPGPNCPNWLSGLQPGQDICINPDLTAIFSCSSNSSKLYLVNNIYKHDSSGKVSAFSRIVKITDRSNWADVESTVSWGKGGTSVKLITTMTKWDPNQ